MYDGESKPSYRIGIDVGGTFTKAVLIDNADLRVVGRYTVLTTHRDPRGVAAGVVEVFRQVLAQSAVGPEDVVFIAHSTTQATNALLEGDVANVGVIATASRFESLLARSQSSIKEIELAPGRYLRPGHRFLVKETANDESIAAAIDALRQEGAQVIVASGAFSVDDHSAEEQVIRLAEERGLPATGGHEITKLYGLTTRTRTAVINASILPKMIDTANMTEASVREAGITAPLMIMRGDGGVMDIKEMRRRPAVTMLSGPAASVAGALMYLKVSDGIYFEVGGTSTNMGVIRNGQPTVKYARVGGHETYINSLDVRILGIAGGSMVRLRGAKISDVGPRSAHIASLPYASFTKPEELVDLEIETFSPFDGDPTDYVVVRAASGKRFAITNTCAANVLGYTKPGMHAYADPTAARLAIIALAARTRSSVEDTARAILECATDKVIPVIKSLLQEYRLDSDQTLLVGEGGGAAALIPFVAERMGLTFKISADAEVISSIGVALALVRETVERIIPNATAEDLQRLKREAFDAVVRLGAAPANVEVAVEIDAQTHRVRATATGASEMRAQDLLKSVSEAEAREVAASSMRLPVENVQLSASTDSIRIFQGKVEEPRWLIFKRRRNPIRAVDREGVIRIQRADGTVVATNANHSMNELRQLWEGASIYNGDSVIRPDVFLVTGSQITDLSGVMSLEHALEISRSGLEGVPSDAPVALVSIQGMRGI